MIPVSVYAESMGLFRLSSAWLLILPTVAAAVPVDLVNGATARSAPANTYPVKFE
jgi:hypothetical protein